MPPIFHAYALAQLLLSGQFSQMSGVRALTQPPALA